MPTTTETAEAELSSRECDMLAMLMRFTLDFPDPIIRQGHALRKAQVGALNAMIIDANDAIDRLKQADARATKREAA